MNTEIKNKKYFFTVFFAYLLIFLNCHADYMSSLLGKVNVLDLFGATVVTSVTSATAQSIRERDRQIRIRKILKERALKKQQERERRLLLQKRQKEREAKIRQEERERIQQELEAEREEFAYQQALQARENKAQNPEQEAVSNSTQNQIEEPEALENVEDIFPEEDLPEMTEQN